MTALLEFENLTVRFRGERTVHAINDLSLRLEQGEMLVLLGESGSGKSVTLKTLLRLLPPKRSEIAGSIRVNGTDVMALKGRALQDYRGGEVSMVFQEPALALDPVYRIGDQIAEAVARKKGLRMEEARDVALDMLRRVRIPSPERRMKNFPHELSGGMRQRVMIALALACRPRLLLADEPTTALDATVQIQILLLLRELQREFGMGVIFVTHDIGVAVEISDRIAVMYAGQIIEEGTTHEVINDPRHPYTRGLLAANLHDVKKGERLDAIPGVPPALEAKPAACSFAQRCPHTMPRCRAALPPMVVLGERRRVACVLEEERGASPPLPPAQGVLTP
ncbi:ABC transporter ATP-binding protein [Haematobacter massiliensis]|uniref:Peptide ABC transporter ATP-binding protein n=1 Tax=Haematobacter massiliensis TaxID=195105 RepID=A0A086Y539_9RHOB|nr:ABC transporter ATP-binding protein [Haematobacter massiliensis]KFI29389.1 peptide ABC transporter ATP-binding protein [Haematobacter massiliensis]OWJ71199.1 ABC transporter ATP-binding protein [Haematobacter massiliensis]OWJ84262.1 ABC transporter ATP-binding protein [Haematobacter massiliensis]QBJ26008.1 ABC transporter ATP-binding protein [Haematobacter massiliensis]